MAFFKSGNPALSEKRFTENVLDDVLLHDEVMTVKGTMKKFAFLFLMVLGTSFYAWKQHAGGGDVMPLVITGAIGGLIVALIISFKPKWSPGLSPLYALLEGLFVGGVSAYFNYAFAETAPNIIINAVGLTFGVVAAMYILYSFRVIRATEKFKSVVITATIGIAVFYLIVWVMRMFGFEGMLFLHQGSVLGIVFSLFVVTIAALNLILDFDRIEQGVQMGSPKYMEWFGAFGLLVTIVWLYIEILRLLSKISGRD